MVVEVCAMRYKNGTMNPKRTLIDSDPYRTLDAGRDWHGRGLWPCFWVACADAPQAPFVSAYTVRFSLQEAATIRVHVSADERYEMFLDGERIGRGPERGDAQNWFFETYDLPFAAGEHVLAARVWSLGGRAAFAQMSVRAGFLLSPQENRFIELMGTGVAPWQAKVLHGYEFTDPLAAWGTGANLVVNAAVNGGFDWDWQSGSESGKSAGWQPVRVLDKGRSAWTQNDTPLSHLLRPALLPPMMEEERHIGTVRLVASLNAASLDAAALGTVQTHDIAVHAVDDLAEERASWQKLMGGEGTLTIAPHTRRRVLVDLDNYYCAYPQLRTSGGANSSIRVHWQESLYCEAEAKTKGNRNEIEGKYFTTLGHLADGIGDTFKPDGGAHRLFSTLWWQCGRYVEIMVETREQTLVLESFSLRETRYPMEMFAAFNSSDERLERVFPIAWRALQMCSHETYMDCPYYEQLMYAGDTRLQVLTTYVSTPDSRLPRKALAMFDTSRGALMNGALQNGGVQDGGFADLTQSRYPSRVRQIIAPFSLWWIGMVHDFAMWRDEPQLVRALLPGVRGVIDYFVARLNVRGLLQAPNGWNFTDWVPAWPHGIPPQGDVGVSGILNWQLVWALSQVAELEDGQGEPEMAIRARRLAAQLASSTRNAFWDEGRGLYADDLEKQHFSEHAQCLAILSGQLDERERELVTQGLLHDKVLARTTIYFTHYLFETLYATGQGQAILDRLGLWFDLEKQGFKTTFEEADPNTSRSDCHAWGAHPIYHAYASLLGIRPDAAGFARVRIAPCLGSLTRLKGTLPHPRGEVQVELELESSTRWAEISLPENVEGTFVWNGQNWPLHGGQQRIDL
jgi:alpha-L-rhamnosidase